ncbi:MAG: PorT family protein [Tannerella sp.]|jgi:hypothetical protein|nr:PorT family protein [Tannerella sp.]
MKKTFLIIALLIVVHHGISAQFVIGPKVGLNVSKEYFGKKIIDEDVDFRTGLNAGVFGKYEINKIFDIQVELLYSQQGYKDNVDIIDYGGGVISEGYKILSHYLNVPVLLKYYPVKRFYIEAGPQVGFCLNSKLSGENKEIDNELNSLKLDYNTVDFSLAGGIGVHVGYGLTANVRYSHGFTKTLSDSDWKNRVIQFSLAYDLWSF